MANLCTSSSKFTLFFILCSFLVACKTEYAIELPQEDSVHTSSPEQFRITYPEQPAALPVLSLNGFDVSEFFTAYDTEATAAGEDFSVYFKQGVNVFQVQPPAGPKVHFIYDTEGPEIVILESSVDSQALLQGVAIDEMGLTQLLVNDQTATLLPSQHFSAEVPASEFYAYQATDSLGHTKTTHYAPLGTLYQPAMTLAVSQAVIDTASAQLLNALSTLDINSSLAGTPLFDGTWTGIGGETYGPEVVLQTIDLTADSAGIDLNNGNGGLIHSASIANSEILFRIHNGFLPPLELVATTIIGPISFDADLQLNVVNQALDVVIDGFSFSMGDVNTSGVGEPFDSYIDAAINALSAAISGFVAPQLEFLFEQVVPVLLEAAIKNSYTITIPDFNTLHGLALALQLDSVYTTEDALFANLAGGGVPIEINENVSQPTAGVIHSTDILPNAALDGGQFGFSLNTNTINQVYASAYAAGLNHLNLVGGQVQMGLPRDDSLGGAEVTSRTIVNPVAPAKLQIRDVDGAAALSFSNYGLEIFSQAKQSDGSFANTMGVKLSTNTSIAVGLKEDNSIDVFLPVAPEYKIEAIQLGDGEWQSGEVVAAANEFIDGVIGLILQQLTEPLANIQMPTFECVNFGLTNISAVGGNHSHLNFAGGVSNNPNCEQTGEPSALSYGRGSGIEPNCGGELESDSGLCYQGCGEDYVGDGSTCYEAQHTAVGASRLDMVAPPVVIGKPDDSADTGQKPNGCEPGEAIENGLCYERCDAGFKAAGSLCIANKRHSYNRKGTPPANVFAGECQGNKEKIDGLCYTPCKKNYLSEGAKCQLEVVSYQRGIGSTPTVCESGQIKRGSRCYDACSSGEIFAGNKCVTVGGGSFDRGSGTPAGQCVGGYEFVDGRCYKACREGFVGQGKLCVPI